MDKGIIEINGVQHTLQFLDTQTIFTPSSSEIVIVTTISEQDGKMRTFDKQTLEEMMSAFSQRQKEREQTTFDKLLDDVKVFHAKKNKDYGNAFDTCLKMFGKEVGTARLYEKAKRFVALVENGNAEVKSESLWDTALDFAIYTFIIKAWEEEHNG